MHRALMNYHTPWGAVQASPGSACMWLHLFLESGRVGLVLIIQEVPLPRSCSCNQDGHELVAHTSFASGIYPAAVQARALIG